MNPSPRPLFERLKSWLEMKNKNIKYFLIFLFIYQIVIYKFTTIYMTIASISYGLLIFGLMNHKTPTLHSRLMSAGMLIDILLVLVLELSRGAINTTLEMSMGPLQQAHIYTSSTAVLLYLPAFYYGRKRLKNPNNSDLRKKHIRFAIPAFIFRSLGYTLMFTLLLKNN